MLEPGGYATKPNSRGAEKCRDNAFSLRKLKIPEKHWHAPPLCLKYSVHIEALNANA